MAQNTLSEVYASLKKQAKAEVLSEIQPKLDRLQALGQEIVSSLSGKKKPGPKPKKATTE